MDMDGFLAISHRVKEAIYSTLGGVSSVLLMILTLFAMLEIIRRYIFGVVFEWGQDGIIVGMVSAVALYFAVTQVRRGHLVMSAIIQLLHARGHYKTVGLTKIAVSSFIALFCGAVGVTGWSTLAYAWNRDLTTYSLLIPLWPFYLILMFGFLLMGFVALLQTVEDIISFAREEYLDAKMEMTTDV
jgi:TRAP-type C4-dicarboxylate transport system permease small subunit